VLFASVILLPSLVLGALVVRSARQQQFVIERQAVDLYQSFTDQLALRIRARLEAQQREFGDAVDALLVGLPPEELAPRFESELARSWSGTGTAFAVTLSGHVLSPVPGDPGAKGFLAANEGFLSNRLATEFYGLTQNTAPVQFFQMGPQVGGPRKVRPSKVPGLPSPDAAPIADSPALPFQDIAARGSSGVLSRFVGDRLETLLWKRAPGSDIVFGASFVPGQDRRDWEAIVADPALTAEDEFCLAILDERGEPVVTSDAGFTSEWDRPFVATRIGDSLPYWEAALYLKDPDRLGRDTRVAQLTLLLVIAAALGVIVTGSVLLSRDTRRRLEWARTRSDFVSTVSHELKTPLTSIRMFADLLAGRDDLTGEKPREFVRVIRSESERLSRLVDNVLDFDRLQRGEKTVIVRTFDAHPVLRRIWETAVEPLKAKGYDVRWDAADPPYRVLGDPDALSQIVVNLVSNAEKYSDTSREIVLQTVVRDGDLAVEVLDRGRGIAPESVGRLFEAFFREDPSLKKGVPGTGLGLHIARHLAEAQGGRLEYASRPGGGSIFRLRLRTTGTEA
jgi:signal transduction histidine kinase